MQVKPAQAVSQGIQPGLKQKGKPATGTSPGLGHGSELVSPATPWSAGSSHQALLEQQLSGSVHGSAH